MEKPKLIEIEQVVEGLVIPFYQINRDMALPIPGRRMENDAEHSWSLALLACSLAPLVDDSLDVGLVCQLAVVHDMVEIYSGDTSVWDSSELLDSKDEREARAVDTITDKSQKFPWIADTIKAYERKDTKEALFVSAVDKLIALIIRHLDKGRFYVEEKHLTKEQFDEGLEAQRQKAHFHPVIGEYYEQLRAIFNEHPEYFYR